MNDLDAVADRDLAFRLERVARRLDAVMRPPAPPEWAPGLRRSATVSDLIRALADGWSPNADVAADTWSVPTGQPDGAETWHSRASAATWLGIDYAALLADLVPSLPAGRPTAETATLADQLTTGSGRHPLSLRARHWPDPNTGGDGWLELTGIARHMGPDGLRTLLVATATWRIHNARHVDTATHPGRDGLLLLTPAGALAGSGRVSVGALGGFVHLLTGPVPRGTLDVLTYRWRSRLLATHRARVAVDHATTATPGTAAREPRVGG